MLPIAGSKRIALLAIVIAVLFGLELRWAGELGFYEDDFIKGWEVSQTAGDGLWEIVRKTLLTDEPLFNLYNFLRYRLLGHDNPSLHHILPGALQIVNLFLVYGLAIRLGTGAPVAIVTELLFGAFPGLGQALYWPSAIYVPLLSLTLAGLHVWVSWLRQGGNALGAAAVSLYAAAVSTHEMAFGAIAVFAAVGVLERARAGNPPPWRALGGLALVNVAYLVVRQTHWLGMGGFTMAPKRPLSLAELPHLGFAAFNLNFGPWFWSRTEALAGLASARRDVWAAVGAAWLLTFAAGWLCDGERLQRPAALAAFWGVAVAGIAIAFAVEPELFLRWFYGALAAAAAVGAVRGADGRSRLVAGALFGLLWFCALFSPAWLYYIAFRHSYMAAPGAALVLASLLFLAGRAVRNPGMSWGATCCLVAMFYQGSLGEFRAWASYHDQVERVREAVQSAMPPVSDGQQVVLVGFQGLQQGNPILTKNAITEAIRLWTGDPASQGAIQLEAQAAGYRSAPDGPLQPYGRLRLLRWTGSRVEEAGTIELASGGEIRLPHGNRGSPSRSARTEACWTRQATDLALELPIYSATVVCPGVSWGI